MPGHDVMVIGFSAGGVEALARLVAALPHDLSAALLVVHHFPAESVTALPRERLAFRYRNAVQDAERGSDTIRSDLAAAERT